MPESAAKVLLLAGGAALTCFVIGLMIYAGDQGGLLASSIVSNISAVNNKVANATINQYNGNVVTGAEVLNAIRSFQDTITVQVSTVNSEGSILETNYSGAERLTNTPFLADGSYNQGYINPYAKFDGSVTVNANGVSSGLIFKQQAFVALANTGQLVGDGFTSGGVHLTLEDLQVLTV